MARTLGPHIYRPDIDGLRALAVLSVIGFHAFPAWLPGGFVGVDVFFVISGFLISQQLFEACDGPGLSISDFYIRRVRRIFPALLVMLVATLIIGWFVLTPGEMQSLQKHVAASAFFSNNILLWSEAGYFDSPARLKPLLHLWSLGVEEQFYLLWPWLIAFVTRRGWNRSTAIAATAVVSFAMCLTFALRRHADAAFYLPHARLWQIAAGAWLASVTGSKAANEIAARSAYANVMAVAGVAAVVFSTFALGRDPAAIYPGWAALLPVIGAMLLLASGDQSWIGRVVFGSSIAVGIGLISYPLYLWHWPLLSFLHITEQGHPTFGLVIGALTAAFMLATATYFLIERPIRARITRARPWRAVGLASALAGIGVVMIAALVTGALQPRVAIAARGDDVVPTALHESQCRELMRLDGGYCQQYLPAPAKVTTALFGDSHASHLFPGLGAVLARRGENVVHLGDTGCPPLKGVEHTNERAGFKCADIITHAIDRLNAMPEITRIVLAFRVNVYTETDEHGASPIRLTNTGETGMAAVQSGLAATISSFLEHGKRVGLVLPVPPLGFELSECVGRRFAFHPQQVRQPCAVRHADVVEQQRAFRDFVTNLRARYPIDVFDPLPFLCHDDWCPAVENGQAYYSDNNHLGMAGSMKVAAMFER